jgi:hypothetical protein
VVAVGLSGISRPEAQAVLQDLALMGQGEVAQQTQVDATPGRPLQEVHQAGLLFPTEAVARRVEDRDIEVAVRPEQRPEDAAVQVEGLDIGRNLAVQGTLAGRDPPVYSLWFATPRAHGNIMAERGAFRLEEATISGYSASCLRVTAVSAVTAP